jgi:hypothetical protein
MKLKQSKREKEFGEVRKKIEENRTTKKIET